MAQDGRGVAEMPAREMAWEREVKEAKYPLPGRNVCLLTWPEHKTLQLVKEYGGFYNTHSHLCRVETAEEKYLRKYGTTPIEASYFPLAVKQDLVGYLHDDVGYTRDNLYLRGKHEIERQIAFGVTRFDTNVDATPDLPEGGLLAIRVARQLQKEYADRIKIRIAPTPIFGFKDDPKDKAKRWDVFQAAAEISDYISLLPEKDQYTDPLRRDGRVGFEKHIAMGMELACRLHKEVQFHLDQTNLPTERGTELLLEGLAWLEQPKVPDATGPVVWVIHMISPSSYPEERFAALIEKLLKFNVGVIVCPTAALSMRQLRPVAVPMHNSIARVAELVKKRVPVGIGTDNIADTFVPWGNGDMLAEVACLANAVRLSTPSILAKLAAGVRPNNVDVTTVGRGLYEDLKASREIKRKWQPAVS